MHATEMNIQRSHQECQLPDYHLRYEEITHKFFYEKGGNTT